jgi:hypothetical protein
MVQCRENVTFVPEPSQDKVGIHASLDYLDGNASPKSVVRPFGYINGTHSPSPDLTIDAVCTNSLTNHGVGFVLNVSSKAMNTGYRVDWFVEKIPGALIL